MKDKRGLSTIVVTLIIILISLVAVGIVWVVVSNLLKSGTQQVSFQFGTLFLNLEIQKAIIDINGNTIVTIQRGVGQGDLTGIAFIVSDGINSQVVKKDTTLQELGAQAFTLTSSELGNIGIIKEISIAPILGEGQIGQKVDDTNNIIQNALSFSTTHSGSGNLYTYWGIYTGNYVIQSGDYLEYDVFCDVLNSVCDGGIEVENNNPYWAGRSYSLKDQNNINDVGWNNYNSKKGQWYHRKVDLAPVVGKTITYVSVTEEFDSSNTYHYYYRNIVITNVGVIKNTFYSGGQPQTNRLNYGSGNINSGVLSYN